MLCILCQIVEKQQNEWLLFCLQGSATSGGKSAKGDVSLDSTLNASDASLEITSEPSNDSVELTGSSENSEEASESICIYLDYISDWLHWLAIRHVFSCPVRFFLLLRSLHRDLYQIHFSNNVFVFSAECSLKESFRSLDRRENKSRPWYSFPENNNLPLDPSRIGGQAADVCISLKSIPA